MINKDGTSAIFTKRINKNEKNQVSVGGKDKISQCLEKII